MQTKSTIKDKVSSYVSVPSTLLFIYVLLFMWSAINPASFNVWIVEAITSVLTVLVLVTLYIKNIRFSNLAYILSSVFPVLHIIGSHYTFAAVPFDWFNDLIGSERNMYDRVAHASVGLYAYLIIEILSKYKLISHKIIAYSYALFLIVTVAAMYELFEWWYAVQVDPEAGIEVLGSQGDIWDAQKDMMMDTLGAILASFIFYTNDKLSKVN